MKSIDVYSDITRNNAEVIRVAWRGPDNLVPVAPGSFVTWVDDRDSAHVAFTHKDTGELFAGDADDLRGLVWLEDGEVRVSSLG